MAIAVVLLLFALLLAGVGRRALALLDISPDHPLDTLLFSLAVGVTLLEVASCGGELSPNVRWGVMASCIAVALVGLFGVRRVLNDLHGIWLRFKALPPLEYAAAISLVVVIALQALAALAPITASDALHYHFTAQAYYLENGFHANWSLLHSYFCGLGHQLILVGIAFGSDRVAVGLTFLGGMAGTLTTLRLTRQFVGGMWPFMAALAFALTPVAFWQIASAGAPDVWMCAMLPLGVLAVVKAASSRSRSDCALAGILAGACAGIKYTGLVMAAALLLALIIETRSAQKALFFFSSAVAVGTWPYLRNWIWTGDPVFPFLWVHLHPNAGNLVALKTLLKDTGASNEHSLLRVLHFPVFALSDYGYAAWQFLGPLVLAFSPFALFSFRNTTLWRTALLVWLIVSLAVGKTSGIPRFLLPVLPIALAASIGGVALFSRKSFFGLRWVSAATLVVFCLAGFAAFVVYSIPGWSVAVGRTSRDDYLRIHAPDYERSLFVNTEVAHLSTGNRSGRALIFFRHLYYLQVPFVDGDPEDSWEMNPAALQSTKSWLDLFSRQQIHWIVRTPNYPLEFAEQLTQLEKMGALAPCAAGTARNIEGFRINGDMATESVTLLCVRSIN